MTSPDQKTREKQTRQAWIEDANETVNAHGCEATARAILVEGLKKFPGKKKVWEALVDLELKVGTDLTEVLKRAMEQSGKPHFAQKYATHLTAQGRAEEAIQVL